MAGIVSYGAYVPIYRLSRATLAQIWGGSGAGEKAVANFDEDSLTMGVEAARDCLRGLEKASIGALYFASTTFPFKEKQAASIMAAALDLREEIVTADIGNSLRSGTLALKMALDTVEAGTTDRVLVVVADCRIPYPDSTYEPILGDGAVAFLIGKDNAAVEIERNCFTSSEFIDNWRLDNDRWVKSWEDRFIREEGYGPHLQKVVSALVQVSNRGIGDFAKVVFPTVGGDQRSMAKALRLEPRQLQNSLALTVGHTGAAAVPMMLVGALEESEIGDRILLANYGDGAEAWSFRVGEGIGQLRDRLGIRRHVASKMMLDSYGRYIKFRQLMEFEPSFEPPPRAALTNMWRERKHTYRLHGHKCGRCGKVQFPKQKYCMYCRAEEKELIDVPLADKKGTLVTFSIDERSPVVDPPNVLAAVNLEGGGRFFSQMTDRNPAEIRPGMPMELTFRRIHSGSGLHNYFWKCKPARSLENGDEK
ncbi:MAG: hydroxymethylglutaryl-CoA synthase family protein [Chloroflexota bacterium]|nr:MAG: hydroxymethylglutaryl-CoA synthase family protein [Chloroflexota bacterium]